ncbi:cation:proton antiporter domain-containing protein [Nannocystis radixulma]|uniref:Cation:proton antiporter n=1 Tax=Nannocystis radixulma TaxID=2995305 RepID=A0ABT5B6Z2_9BACT|nr:cation:proton antiporter [Nannocystis radixulma]MDC0669872.1 cation:proton antiporter [Nannocystis radixulma]
MSFCATLASSFDLTALFAFVSETAAAAAPPAVIKGLAHHAVLMLLIQIAVLLAMARFLGEIMRKLKQPPVVGELMAGVVLGPSVLGLVWPEAQHTLFPKDQHLADLLAAISWIGVLFLLICTGLETDLGLIKRRGKTALMISAGGILVPFATGFALGEMLPEAYLANPDARLVFSLFMAVAMSISAVPVIAKVLMDLKLIRRDIGQLILAAAMTDDTIGWILLAVVAGLAKTGVVDVLTALKSIGGAVLFMLFAFTLGAPLISRIMATVDKRFGGSGSQMSLVLAIAFATAALTHEMGIEAVLGAFTVGILAGQAPRFRHEVAHTLELVTASFLAPIFFASAGVKVDLMRLADPEVATVGAIVLAIACFGKFVGCYLGAWVCGISHWERLALGSGMNARGAMEIIVATIGLSLGVLGVEMYSIVVMVAIATSLMAPPLLRWTLSKVKMGESEAKRLEMEALAASSFIRQVRRVLMVSRNANSVDLPAQILGYLSHEQPIEVTAVYARPQAVRTPWWRGLARRVRRYNATGARALERIGRPLRLLKGSRPELKVISDADPAEQVLAEAARDYELLVLGETQRSTEALFGPMADRIIHKSPCPTLIVREPTVKRAEGGKPPLYRLWSPKKILVPTVGTEYSKNAVEFAAVLAVSTKAEVTIVHISRTGSNDVDTARPHEIGAQIVAREAERAKKFGASVETVVMEGARPEEDVVRLAEQGGYDLLVIGSSLRAVSARAFFGHRVESMLKNAPCPVVLLSAG